MLQSIASYIWGANDADATEDNEEFDFELELECDPEHEDDVDTDNEWIVVPTKDIESDFSEQSEQEDDMMVEDGETQQKEEENEEKKEDNGVVSKENAKPTNGKRQVLLKRALLKDWNNKVGMLRKNATQKKLKRINMVRVRVNGSKKNKQAGRMEGKHVGMTGQRAK